MPALTIGDMLFNRWKVLDIVRGGLGIVYIVSDRDKYIYVAKTFQSEIVQNQLETRARFIQECESWISIDPHSNIVDAMVIRIFAGKPYIVMEFVDDKSLAERIRSINNQSGDYIPAMLRFAIQFCDGMMHAYKSGIVAHRDIKPSNCLIDKNNILKITDFGLARAVATNASEGISTSGKTPYLKRLLNNLRSTKASSLSGRLTVVGIAAGSPPYMAPEQFEDFGSTTAMADVYSFGVMFFEMINGLLPFRGKTSEEYYRHHKNTTPPEILHRRNWDPKLTQRLGALTKACLEKSPKMRPANFAEIRKELERIFKLVTGSEAPQESKMLPLTARRFFLRGETLSNIKKWDQAIVCLERGLELSPHDPYGESELAKARCYKGDQTTALLHFKNILALYPNSSETWGNQAASLRLAGRPNEALESCNKALALDNKCVEAMEVMGLLLMDSREYKSAMNIFIKASEVDVFEPRYPYLIAKALTRLGNGDKAKQMYRLSLDLDPWNATTWYDLGVLLGEEGRYQEEIKCYEQALQIEPGHSNALANKGVALCSLDRFPEALIFFDQALAINSNDKVAWHMKAEALYVLNRYADARTCYLRAKSLGQAIPPDRIETCDSHIGS